MDQYDKGPVVGQGTFGSVYRATHRGTGRVVAIKKVRIGDARDGVNAAALREVKVLKELHHPNVISLLEVFPHKSKLHLVFEFMEADLEAIIQDHTITISPGDIKVYLQMALHGLEHVHGQGVVHRDLKPNNLLVSAAGELKVADFGVARLLHGTPGAKLTNQVFTRSYRPPELLFGATEYDGAADMWALGCIAVELVLRRVWLPGGSDMDQLERIFQARGTPTNADWPEARGLPTYVAWKARVAPPLRTQLPDGACDLLLELLEGLLQLNPARRPTAAQALAHTYFKSGPPPTPPASLARPQRKVRTLLAPIPSLLNLSQAVSTFAPQASMPHHDGEPDPGRALSGLLATRVAAAAATAAASAPGAGDALAGTGSNSEGRHRQTVPRRLSAASTGPQPQHQAAPLPPVHLQRTGSHQAQYHAPGGVSLHSGQQPQPQLQAGEGFGGAGAAGVASVPSPAMRGGATGCSDYWINEAAPMSLSTGGMFKRARRLFDSAGPSSDRSTGPYAMSICPLGGVPSAGASGHAGGVRPGSGTVHDGWQDSCGREWGPASAGMGASRRATGSPEGAEPCGAPMSTDTAGPSHFQWLGKGGLRLSSKDISYLQQRKLDMDQALEHASLLTSGTTCRSEEGALDNIDEDEHTVAGHASRSSITIACGSAGSGAELAAGWGHGLSLPHLPAGGCDTRGTANTGGGFRSATHPAPANPTAATAELPAGTTPAAATPDGSPLPKAWAAAAAEAHQAGSCGTHVHVPVPAAGSCHEHGVDTCAGPIANWHTTARPAPAAPPRLGSGRSGQSPNSASGWYEGRAQ